MANAALMFEIQTSARECLNLVNNIDQKTKVRIPKCTVTLQMPQGGGMCSYCRSRSHPQKYDTDRCGNCGREEAFVSEGQNVGPKFSVTENFQEVASSQLLAELKLDAVKAIQPDLFNDKLDYSCSKYADLKRLAQGMLDIALKYDMFGESEKATPVLKMFRDNYKIVLAGLRAAWACIQDKASSLAKIQDYINTANSALGRAAEAKAVFVHTTSSESRSW